MQITAHISAAIMPLPAPIPSWFKKFSAFLICVHIGQSGPVQLCFIWVIIKSIDRKEIKITHTHKVNISISLSVFCFFIDSDAFLFLNLKVFLQNIKITWLCQVNLKLTFYKISFF